MHIAIVGAGLVGRLLGWQLLEKGHDVTLFDKDNGSGEQSAGMVAAAMLAPLSEVLHAEPEVYHHGLAGISTWRQWVDQLNHTTDTHVAMRHDGSIVVAHRQDSGDYRRLVQQFRSHPSIDQDSVIELDCTRVNELEPELSERFDRGCLLGSEGWLDNHALFAALSERMDALGGRREKADIAHLDNETLPGFDHVIDCRGFGAATDIADLRGVRGEVIRVKAPEVNLTRPVRLVHPRYKLYISPKPGRRYVIGATQIESSSEAPVTVRSSLEMLSALYSIHTGFSEAHIIEQSARCRPAFADNLPRIEQDGNVLRINGLFRHGYLLAPTVIEQALFVLGEGSNNSWPAIVR